jgi:hypothetical protein
MEQWKKIYFEGIAKIEKCVAEFTIWELNKTPYGKFKIRIFEGNDDTFSGYSNIKIKQLEEDSSECAVGFGKDITGALEDTLKNFIKMINVREEWNEEHFEWAHPDDF